MGRKLLFVTVILSQLLLSLATRQVLRFTTGADPNATRLVHETAEKFNFDIWASNPQWTDVMIPASAFDQVSALGISFSVMMSDVELYVEQHLEMVKVSSCRLLISCSSHLFFLLLLRPSSRRRPMLISSVPTATLMR